MYCLWDGEYTIAVLDKCIKDWSRNQCRCSIYVGYYCNYHCYCHRFFDWLTCNVYESHNYIQFIHKTIREWMVLLPILFISRVHGPLLSASKGSFQKQQKSSSAIFPRLVIGLEEAKQRCMYRSICWLCPLDKSLRRWFEGMHILHVFQRFVFGSWMPLRP